MAADSRIVTDAAIGLLRDAGLTVYDAQADEGATAPYIVVYPVSDNLNGTMASPSADANRTVQVNAIGTTREEAQGLADAAAGALLGANHHEVRIEGRALMGPIRQVSGRWLGRDEDTAKPALFGYAADYVFQTTPSNQ